MRRSRGLAHRSRLELVVRGLLAATALWLGYNAASHSFADVLTSQAPDRAHRLAPGDGLIAASLARELSGATASPRDRIRADSLARTALRRDPSVVSAVGTLGVNAQLRGDTTAARHAFAYAQQLSRRDLTVQLWAIEDAVSRKDIAGALNHYDIALRTSKRAPEILFPVLAGAIAADDVRHGLVRTLAGKPPWGNDFIVYAAATSGSPQATVSLLRSMERARITVPPAANARAIDALLATGDVTGAWRYYVSLYPTMVVRASRDPRFTASLSLPTRFDWNAVNDSSVTATIEPSSQGGRFDFSTSPGTGGPVLRQMQVLPAGDYIMEGVASVEPSDAPRPYWSLTCVDGRELGRVELKSSDGRFAGRLQVPVGCRAQSLTLIARPSDQMASIAGHVSEARLRPAALVR